MASLVPLKEKKLMEVKLGELPSWIMMRDFTPSGIAGAFRRGYDRYYNKYINVRKGSISGISMVLAAYVVFSYCISYKELSKSSSMTWVPATQERGFASSIRQSTLLAVELWGAPDLCVLPPERKLQ